MSEHHIFCNLKTGKGWECNCEEVESNINVKKYKPKTSVGFVASPFEEVFIKPGDYVDMITKPQVSLAGPYYLGVRTDMNALVYVERLQFANVTPIVSHGSIPHVFFEKELNQEWPKGLIPIDGPNLYIANAMILRIRNKEQYSIKVLATIWAKQDHGPYMDFQKELGDFE